MAKKISFASILLFSASLIITGCTSTHSLSQGRSFKLRQVSFSDLNGWEQDNFKEAMPGMIASCKNPIKMFSRFCKNLPAYRYASSDEIKAYFEKTLKPYQVISYGQKTGTITGYYEAELTGSRERISSSQIPIYGLPKGYKNGKKYPEREEIEEEGIDAPILAWADDPVELFILHIQGSGRLITPEGEIKLGYAGNNARSFKKLSQILKDSDVDLPSYSMPSMKKWLQENTDEARKLMAKNPRYIFFKETKGDSPYGAAGVVLTPGRSVAVDKNFIPLNTPMWLNTKDPHGYNIQKLVIAQDIGSAIKGGIRADYFWGHGEVAFEKAGRMKSIGSYYLLLPKD